MTEPNMESASRQNSDASMRDMLAPLFRRKRTFALTFLAVLLGTVVTAFMFAHTHEAKMEILVNEQRLDPTVSAQSTQSQTAAPPVTDNDIGSEVELLQSPELLQGVVIANDLQDQERKGLLARLFPGRNDAWYIAKATKHLAGKLKIDNVSKTNLIEVMYKSSDPQLAYNVLQTLGRLYLAQHLTVHRPQGAYAFFASQTQKYQQALADSESQLADFTKTSGIAAPDLQRTAMAQQVVNSVDALESCRQIIAADKHRIEEEEARIKVTPDRSPTQQVSDSAQTLLQQLQAALLAAEVKKTQLMMKYDPSYPLVLEAEQEITETQAAIVTATKQQYINQTTDRDPTYELMREDIAKTQSDLAFHQASAQALEISIRTLQTQMLGLDQEAVKQADLSREVRANEANYLLYLSKREQERTSDALDERRISNVAIAVSPIVPILPSVSPGLAVLCGLMLAACLSAGAAFIAEYLNPALRTPGEVLEVLGIPVLASVSKQTA
jgi:polysaccharide biosynthesis transport protein